MDIGSYYIPSDPDSKEVIKKFEDLRWRERKSKSELTMLAIKEYVLNHAEGNDSFTLDAFVKNPELEATPALSRNKQDILNFISKVWDTNRQDSIRLYIENWVSAWNEVEESKCQ